VSDSTPAVYLSLDVEEFDLPNEYGAALPLSQQLQIGQEGFQETIPWLDQLGARCTLFTTARFAEHAPELIKDASARHEIASHGVRHDTFKEEDYLQSRQRLEAIAGCPVTGFRMPRLQPIDSRACQDAGYRYDSSENPIKLPGRYDNRHLPRTPRMEDRLLRIPISTSPVLRVPLFWLAWGNIPRPLLRNALDRALAADGRLILFFHPWEFVDLPALAMPRVVRRRLGPRLKEIVGRELTRLASRAEFRAMRDISLAEEPAPA